MKNRTLTKQEIFQAILGTEIAHNEDRAFRALVARIKLYMSDDGQNALIWLIRFLVRSHPNPRPVFEHTTEILDEHKEELNLISTIFENELEMRYKDLAKNKDRK